MKWYFGYRKNNLSNPCNERYFNVYFNVTNYVEILNNDT